MTVFVHDAKDVWPGPGGAHSPDRTYQSSRTAIAVAFRVKSAADAECTGVITVDGARIRVWSIRVNASDDQQSVVNMQSGLALSHGDKVVTQITCVTAGANSSVSTNGIWVRADSHNHAQWLTALNR